MMTFSVAACIWPASTRKRTRVSSSRPWCHLLGCGMASVVTSQRSSTYPNGNADRVFSDSVDARALEITVDAGNTTVESCVAVCQAQGFSLAGVEYGSECCASIVGAQISAECINDHQGVVHNFSMVQRTLGTMTILDTAFTGQEAQINDTAIWPAKATPLNCVADRPCSISTILPGCIPLEPLSCQRQASGPR